MHKPLTLFLTNNEQRTDQLHKWVKEAGSFSMKQLQKVLGSWFKKFEKVSIFCEQMIILDLISLLLCDLGVMRKCRFQLQYTSQIL